MFRYSQKFGIAESKMKEKLWGNNYFDAENKKWVKKDQVRSVRCLLLLFKSQSNT